MAETNKVKFGIKNCYYSVITENDNGTVTYGTPVRFPGAVSLSLDASGGEPEKFYADDIVYYQSSGSNDGYEGDFEVARVIDAFHTDVLGDIADDNGMMVEDADAISKKFALIVQFSGDKHNTRHVLYNCTASRPNFGSATIEDTATPQTETITITAIPQIFGEKNIVKGKKSPTDTGYDTFFEEVAVPVFGGNSDPNEG